MNKISDERLAEMLAGMEGVTPGDWGAWKSPEAVWMVRATYADEQGRRCTAWPAVCNAGAQDNEVNAKHFASLEPDTMRSIISELLASREGQPVDVGGDHHMEAIAAGCYPLNDTPTPREAVAWPDRKFCEVAEHNVSELAMRLRGGDHKQVASDAALAIHTLLAHPTPAREGQELRELVAVAKKRLTEFGWQVDSGEAQGGGREFERRVYASFTELEAALKAAQEADNAE